MALQNLVLPLLPVSLFRDVVHKIYARHSLTCTNVPGPAKQILVAGKPVSTCRFAIGHIHPVFSMLSYNGQINITLVADDEAIPDVHVLQIFYMRALVALGNEFKVGIPACLEAASERGFS